MTKNRAEDVSDRQESAVDTALADLHDPAYLVGGVTDEHDHALVRRPLERAHRYGSHIRRRGQSRRTGLALSESG